MDVLKIPATNFVGANVFPDNTYAVKVSTLTDYGMSRDAAVAAYAKEQGATLVENRRFDDGEWYAFLQFPTK
jgi:hypothetical protein